MGESRSTEDRVRHACARVLARLADTLDDEPPAAPRPPAPAAGAEREANNFRYDDELPPTVPPGERLDEWHRAHAPPRRPQGRVATLLRRAARRLDGTVIARQPFG